MDQFLSVAFAQLTYRESLREIETCLLAMNTKLYHAELENQSILRDIGQRGTITNPDRHQRVRTGSGNQKAPACHLEPRRIFASSQRHFIRENPHF